MKIKHLLISLYDYDDEELKLLYSFLNQCYLLGNGTFQYKTLDKTIMEEIKTLRK